MSRTTTTPTSDLLAYKFAPEWQTTQGNWVHLSSSGARLVTSGMNGWAAERKVPLLLSVHCTGGRVIKLSKSQIKWASLQDSRVVVVVAT